MIDLHTHTTASDGRCTPEELVARAARAGVTVLGVTDHDTVAGCEPTAAACAGAGIEFVPGIEITAVADGIDVHVLGYFIDAASAALGSFLAEQRQRRLDRVRAIVERLAAHGIPLDADAIIAPAVANPSMAVGRPWIARALVAGGHVADTGEAFERWLATGRAAFVPADGCAARGSLCQNPRGGRHCVARASGARRARRVDSGVRCRRPRRARGVSLGSRRGRRRRAISASADRLGLAVSGGSDFHGDDESHGPGGPGSVALPRDRFDRLKALGVR